MPNYERICLFLLILLSNYVNCSRIKIQFVGFLGQGKMEFFCLLCEDLFFCEEILRILFENIAIEFEKNICVSISDIDIFVLIIGFDIL